MQDESKKHGPDIINIYDLGFHDEWPEVLDAIIDIQNSGKLDETSVRMIRMVLDGWSFREIGREFNLSHNTIIKRLKEIIGG